MRLTRTLTAAASLLAFLAAIPAAPPPDRLTYPETRRDATVDLLHGKKVTDPYRWLEDDARTSQEVADWVAAQNRVTFGYLESLPQREPLRARLTELWDYEKFSSPFRVAGRYYFFRNDGLQNQSALFATDGLDSQPVVVLDRNTWSEDGTVALTGLSISEDGRYLAYSRATAGSDWQEWFVRDLATGEDLGDHLKWTKFTGTAWTRDGRGFFYSRYDAPPEGEAFKALNKFQKVYYHRVGTAQSSDVLVYERPDQPEWGFSCNVTEDGRYLVMHVWKGTDPKNRLLVRDLTEPYAMPVEIIGGFDNEYQYLANDGPVFYLKTDLDAPRGRIIALDLRHPEREHWKEIIPQSPEALEGVDVVNNMFILSYLKDAVRQVRLHQMNGRHVRDVKFPGIGTASGFNGRRTHSETFYTYSSFNRPPSIYRYDLLTGESSLWKDVKVAFDPERYTVKQVFYKSKDGTRVPMFVAHLKDLPMDGNRPTLLYGYGGFSISLLPSFSVTRLAWMELGGVFAMPNLRGGGEYGEDWHRAGTGHNKQNVFDDFIAAAEYLVEARYTRRERLAIQGGSNGGLLVGAAMTQRPDLFGAALPAVGVMDMLRFHKFTAGRFWVDDYGSPDDPEMFPTLRAYSPYHNLKPGTSYPATLVTTADTDDRVVPGHSFKFAAALQRAHGGKSPVLIRIETSAGHGAGKPTSKRIEEAADQMAFLFKNLEMDRVQH